MTSEELLIRAGRAEAREELSAEIAKLRAHLQALIEMAEDATANPLPHRLANLNEQIASAKGVLA